jgi:glycosyltransferase involved in cell wall biosynthesis
VGNIVIMAYQKIVDVADEQELIDEEFPVALRGKRVALFSESLGPINGVSRTTTQIIRYLQANGVDLKLIAPHYIGEATRPALALGPVRRLGGMPLPYSPELSVAYPFRFDRVCGTFKPDLVYLASPASVGYQAMLQIRCLANAPPVIGNFQTDLSAYSDILFPAPMDSYAVWLLRLVEGYLYSHESVKAVFYPSSPVADYMSEAGVQREKLVHLGRGVDTELFTPRRRDDAYKRELAPDGEIILLCVGRLAPEKGFGYLAQVAQRLAQLNIPFKMVITGGNRNPAVEEEVRGFFAPIRDRVVFTGFLEGAALARVYASADIFLHCSITETFGLVVLEAMACGVPVVARDAGGPSEIVRDCTSGFLVEQDDLEAFVSRTSSLIQNSELRERMSNASRTIAENTTWKRINNRVAQQMLRTLQEHEGFGSVYGRSYSRRSLAWGRALIGTIYVELKINIAMLWINLFWVIAVAPLMIHGSLAFPRNRSTSGAQVFPVLPSGVTRPAVKQATA